MAWLEVALMGSFTVTVDGRSADGFGYDKVRALLAYLLLEGERPIGRDALAALLWPDAPAGAARKNLRTALATLRQAIGDAQAQPPLLRIERDSIGRNPLADLALDVTELRAHLAAVERHAHSNSLVCSDCADRLAQAAALYRGPFLQQISVPDSVAWEEWALLTRERLHGRLLDALAQLMAYHEQCGEDDRARQYAWRVLGQEAWDEAAHRCLMRVHARSGKRNAALAQYERCRELLAEELGIAPAAETTALYEQIRTGPLERSASAPSPISPPVMSRTSTSVSDAVAPPLGALNTLPRPLTSLIGRETEVAELRAQLKRPDVQLLTLVGPPGIGKTRLAIAAAAALHETFPDGIVFVALAPISDPTLVLNTIASTLEVQEIAGQSLAATLTQAVRAKALLLVLDNFEQVVEAAPLVGELRIVQIPVNHLQEIRLFLLVPQRQQQRPCQATWP